MIKIPSMPAAISRTLIVPAALAVLCAAGGCRPDSARTVARHDYPLDTILRLNHIQAKGTHNSYHIQKGDNTLSVYKYTHQPLDIQLENGVRQVELDLHYIDGKGLKVYHLPVIDDLSTCDLFVDCLTTIKRWSDGHPEHHAILIFLEPKDEVDAVKLPGRYADIENAILSVFPRERILTPDEVRGTHATLREAILTDGWPVLGKTRGRVFFHVNDSGAFRDAYLAAYPALAGALMFIDSAPADPFAATMPMNNPVGDAAAIHDAVLAGFIVRTMAGTCCTTDTGAMEADIASGLSSGAHIISTDFPVPVPQAGYSLTIPGGTPSRCNPVAAPISCTSTDIENGT